jgi:hypothetical protein
VPIGINVSMLLLLTAESKMVNKIFKKMIMV